MGPPSATTSRSQDSRNAVTSGSKTHDVSYAPDQTSRRPTGDRRNLSNSEDIILRPPKMSFASSSSARTIGGKSDASNFLNTTSNFGGGASARGIGARDTRNPDFRRRGDADQEGDGWSTVKPRKSFGHDGAERFYNRINNSGSGGADMGSNGGGVGGGSSGLNRFGRDDRKSRDRDDIDTSGRDRPRRTFDRDGGDDNADGPRRNGPSSRVPWFNRDNNSSTIGNGNAIDDRSDRNDRNDRGTQRDRIDRARNWRDRVPDSQSNDSFRDRNNDRGGYDRRWDRDRDYFHNQRVERDPEWMDEEAAFADDVPADGSGGVVGFGSSGSGGDGGGHTEEDLRRFIAEMKGRNADGAKPNEQASGDDAAAKTWRAEPVSTPAVEPGPDRFFEQFIKTTKAEDGSIADADAAANKAKSSKASKFSSFFSSQSQTEPSTPAALPAPAAPHSPSKNEGMSGMGGFGGFGGFGGTSGTGDASSGAGGLNLLAAMAPPDAAEKEAFQALLLKLQRQTLGSTGSAGSTTSPAAPGSINIGSSPGPNDSRTPVSIVPTFQESRTAALNTTTSRQHNGLTSPDPLLPPGSQSHSRIDGRNQLRFQQGGMPQQQQPQQSLQDLLMQRQQQPLTSPGQLSGQSPPVTARPEQMIQELLLQRQQHAVSQEGGQPRPEPPSSGPGPSLEASNSQTDFLMKLMQSRGPDARRSNDLTMRMPQPQKQVNIPSVSDREAELAEFTRERLQRQQQQQMRASQGASSQGLPPGMFSEEHFHRAQDGESRPAQQPTQILQRAPPPGLEHPMHGPLPPYLQQQGGGASSAGVGAGGAPGRMPPQQGPPQQQGHQQPMIPPPGLGPNHPTNPQNRVMSNNMANMPGMPSMPGMPNIHRMPLNLPPNMQPNLPNLAPNMMSKLPNMPNLPPNIPPNMLSMPPNLPPNLPPNMYPQNFSPSGPFSPEGPPRNLPPPPPGFFNGPPGPQGFMPPPGIGFQGPSPDGMPFPFDGRGMLLPPHGGGFRRS
ncbi:hypothetical protein SEPCBS57363_005826 [Sporothrix epigloea]|uniref:Uncharacterized protein n=1 Tax=Sporothrix epigloea TaxID=1892477 RepID=A0ABP0DZP8_9PEZI